MWTVSLLGVGDVEIFRIELLVFLLAGFLFSPCCGDGAPREKPMPEGLLANIRAADAAGIGFIAGV